MIADAVVLAGGSSKGLAEAPAKGLIDINGKPMVEYVLDALLACPSVGRICVVVPPGIGGPWIEKADVVVESDGTLTQNFAKGVAGLKTSRKVIVLSSDIPLLTPEAIGDFLDRCAEEPARLYYPIIPEKDARNLFPDMKRTYVKMKEGSFTGGNIALIDPSLVDSHAGLMEEAYAMRKSPFKLAKRLGFKFVVKALLGTLSVKSAEERVGEMLGSPVKAVITPYPEIGLDVDKASDLEIIRKHLAGDSFGVTN